MIRQTNVVANTNAELLNMLMQLVKLNGSMKQTKL